MKNRPGPKLKFDENLQIFVLRMPDKYIKQLKKVAVKNGYTNRSSGGVSGFARDLILKELQSN